MKTEMTETKSESITDPDPITAAASALARAVDQAQRAIVVARNEPSPALVASEAKCEALEAKVRALEEAALLVQQDLVAARTFAAQRETELTAKERGVDSLKHNCTTLSIQVVALRQELRAAHQASAQRDTELGVKQRAITQSENMCTVAYVAKERTAWARDRDDFGVRVQELEQAEAALREDRAFLDDEHANFDDHRRTSLANLKRTVSSLQAEVSKQERSMPAGSGMAPGPSRKRQRVDSRLHTRSSTMPTSKVYGLLLDGKKCRTSVFLPPVTPRLRSLGLSHGLFFVSAVPYVHTQGMCGYGVLAYIPPSCFPPHLKSHLSPANLLPAQPAARSTTHANISAQVLVRYNSSLTSPLLTPLYTHFLCDK
ncbi:hypothetical protein FB451DRAFT_1179845 [Mycena latifolia]|nr:hypothetical protein FB451DRAFT_1179845 [Mycena latifolia]